MYNNEEIFKAIDERFKLIELISNENELDTDLIKKAYQKAKLLHSTQLRKDLQTRTHRRKEEFVLL